MALKDGNGFLRRIVRQAEDCHVGALQEVGAHVLVAPLGFRNGEDVQIMTAGQPCPDLQSCGAVFAVDKDFRFHGKCL